MTRARRIRIAAGALLIGFAGLNILAWGHARTMTHFAAAGPRTGKAETLSWGQKLGVLAVGVQIPKPRNDKTPLERQMPFDTWMIEVEPGITLEAWAVRAADAHGVVVMFHGYADRKSSALGEARVFYDLGWVPVLVDLRGSGGSSGDTTSIGFHEARDVEAAAAVVHERFPRLPLVAWGASMGAAASLRAVGELGTRVDGLLIEAPFATLRSAVVNRFHSLGVPAFGLAELLVFWGGEQLGFNGFAHNPVEYAAHVRSPTLLMLGSRDDRVLMPEGRAIFDALAGEKQFEVFEGLRHESLVRGNREQWVRVVGAFLNRISRTPSRDAQP
ncbi:MAG: lysophospholipase [Vicinamibacteria bacterium]|nr:lysophospholipase [Vicinamibacteria bacterium]